jgi:hypothetical protein
MKLIVETDIGRDADDFFALCYLISAGVEIVAVTVSPGDKDQIAVAKGLLKECGVDCPVGSGKPNRDKSSVGGRHLDFLKQYNYPLECEPDGVGENIIAEAMIKHPDAELFVCGPLHSVGPYLLSGGKLGRATMQGGFMGYEIHNLDVVRLEKFENKLFENTFNLGGSQIGAHAFLNLNVAERSFVGKHLCHTIVYDKDIHASVKKHAPTNRAMEVFHEHMDLYLEHQPVKMFHDPTAAVCHLHPECATWLRGKLIYQKGKWGTELCEDGDLIAVDINREMLWDYITRGV